MRGGAAPRLIRPFGVGEGTDLELGHEPIEHTIAALCERPLSEIRQAVFDLAAGHGPQVDDRTLLPSRLR